MFGLVREQWIVTKGVREIVIIAERKGFLIPSKREDTVKGMLACGRDLGLATKKIPAHEQVMILAMTFFGIAAGPLALADAAKWAAEYADQHKQRHVLAACMETATDLVEACQKAESRRT